ncbi:WG repeat-containing protein [Desulfopila sp. IMCC35008]|uniref:WG repeat-containing protein n=1 Tax=Desulfopila sp. IMCC35008 TaxID=2653858 RepID=UPI0013D61C9C|nr:WG repeat-containing protein [Desulfopila sp. IMCC35008]
MKHLVFASLFFLLSTNTVFAYECFYAARLTAQNTQSEVISQGDCVDSFEDGILVLKENHFDNFDFSSGQPSYLFLVEDTVVRVFFVSKQRVLVETLSSDNGPDEFVEGLARVKNHGKYGFVNTTLDVVIMPKYDFAYPFENGHSIVCNGCEEKPDGEHRILSGGRWGLINREGEVIIPMTLSRSELQKIIEENIR